MAVSLSTKSFRMPKSTLGGMRIALVTVTFDDSYAAGGEPVDFGYPTVWGASQVNCNTNHHVRLIDGKLRVFDSTGAEVVATTNLATTEVVMQVIAS